MPHFRKFWLRPCKSYKLKPVKRTTILEFFSLLFTLPWGTRGFSRLRREFSVMAEGRHIFSRRPVHYKYLTETGNCATIVSGTQGNSPSTLCRLKFPFPKKDSHSHNSMRRRDNKVSNRTRYLKKKQRKLKQLTYSIGIILSYVSFMSLWGQRHPTYWHK